MTTVDFAPLFRTAIGFDRLARLVDTAASGQEAQSYPPYNIEKTGDDAYRLTMAVAGFRPEDLDITVKDNTLFVSGRVANEGQKPEILYRGIAGRAFERRFVLADHIVVEGADVQHGLLHVGLKRVVPEALKPRRIAIGNVAPAANGPSAIAPSAAIANDSQDNVKAA
jgi:molecular chaperone IbpA